MFKLQISEYQEGLWTEWEDTDYIGDNKEALEFLYRSDRTEVGYRCRQLLEGIDFRTRLALADSVEIRNIGIPIQMVLLQCLCHYL